MLRSGTAAALKNLLMRLTINGEEREFAADLDLNSLVEQLELQPVRIAIELNRDIVRRADWPGVKLQDGDRLEIVQFVGGGSPEQEEKKGCS